MNISLHFKTQIKYWLLGLLPMLAVFELEAQSGGVDFVSLEVVLGDTLTYDFYSTPPYSPQIDQYGVYPLHGTADLPGPGPLGVPGQNTLTYIPTTSTPAIDTVFIKYWVFNGATYNSVDLTLEILVKPSIVHALDDYTETEEGTPVQIDVLSNDWTNGEVLSIADVPMINNGSFELNADSTLITFTPAAGFSGVANFNYTICDDMGTCDMATVNIGVMPAILPLQDTLRLTTPKNSPRSILINLDGFTLTSGPDNGTLDMTSADYPIYLPNPDFADDFDHITFEKDVNGDLAQVYVIIHVLDVPGDNTFVMDDQAFTSKNNPVVIQATNNDLGGQDLNNVSVVSQPNYGTAVTLSNGVFEYTPNPDFVGIDQFVYRAFSPNYSVVEYGTVYVVVSNHVPVRGTFELATPKFTPLVLGYNVPIYDYNFTLTVAPDYGVVEYYPGQNTVTLNGQTFSGYNMLIYTPDSTLAQPGVIDEFEIEYCVVNNACPTAEVKVDIEILDIDVDPSQFCVGDNCVWAGDTNLDGLVDMRDLLPIGMCMGEVGNQRPNPDLSQWFGQFGEDWNDIFNSEATIDLKHIDTDGNGIIGALDTFSINAFYGNEHSIIAETVGPQIDVPLYFYSDQDGPVEAGDMVSQSIWLGDPNDIIAEDIYGFTFTLQYDASYVDPASVEISFTPDSWLAYNSPILYMTKKPTLGFIDAGFTRTSGLSETGYGLVGQMDFVVIEDVEGIRLKDQFIDLKLTNITVMNSAGQTFALPDASIQIPVRLAGEEEPSTAKLKASPNPAQSFLHLHLNGQGQLLDQVNVYSLSGQLVHQAAANGVKDLILDTQNWIPGLYIVQVISTEGEVIAEKVEVFH